MVFEYTVILREGEEYYEKGTVVAKDEEEAGKKLQELGAIDVRLKRLHGFRAFLKGLTADVK
jgi:hypothetical protein